MMAGWWNNDSWYLIVHLSNVFWDEISREKKNNEKRKPQKPQDILFSDALNKRTLFKEEEEEDKEEGEEEEQYE